MKNDTKYHPSVASILRHFQYEHLPLDVYDIAKACADLAIKMADKLPSDPETTVGLRKLLEARDCFNRASLMDGEALLVSFTKIQDK